MLLSMIVPVYNTAEYIEPCVNSLMMNDIFEYEIILVDDGSTDGSGAVCEQLARNDTRINVYHMKNGGVSRARNFGLSVAKGEFIMFVDSDDRLADNTLQQLMPFLTKQTAWDLLIFGFTRKCGATSVPCSPESGKFSISEYAKVYPRHCKKYISNSPWNKVYKRDIIFDHKIFFPEHISLGEDLLFNNAILRVCNRILTIEQVLYEYHQRDKESLTRRYYPNLFEIYEQLYRDTMQTLEIIGSATQSGVMIKELYYYHTKEAICSVDNPRSKLTYMEKHNRIKIIVCSLMARECAKYARDKDLFWLLIRSRSVTGILAYLLMSKIKIRFSCN